MLGSSYIRYVGLIENKERIVTSYGKYQISELDKIFRINGISSVSHDEWVSPNLNASFYLGSNSVEKSVEYYGFEEIFNAKKEYGYYILLGEAGYGKSSLLKRLQVDYLINLLRRGEEKVCLYYEFKRYAGFPKNNILDVLEKYWMDTVPAYMPSFRTLLKQGQVVLLLDAINETMCYNKDIVDNITRSLIDIYSFNENNKIIVSCRTSYYYPGWFNFPDRYAEVDIKVFNFKKIKSYLKLNIPDLSDNVVKVIFRKNLLSFYCVPYYLKLLVQILKEHGVGDGKKYVIPNDLCYLFDRFVKAAITSEIRGTNSVFADEDLIDKELQNKIIRQNSLYPDDSLCFQSPFFRQLSILAFNNINYACKISDASDACLQLDAENKKVIKVAISMGFMEMKGAENVFRHSLLQSYFAGLYFFCEFNKSWDMLEAISTQNINAWKDVLLFVARLIRENGKLIRYIDYLKSIDSLFACDVVTQEKDMLDEKYIDSFRDIALSLSQEDAEINKRINAGMILGRLGDKRFVVLKNDENSVQYIIPPISKVIGGRYEVQYDERNKVNMDVLDVEEFYIGQYLVTNYEYSKFIDAGGYNDHKYWESDLAKMWINGEWVEWVKVEWLKKYKVLQRRKNLALFLLLKGTITVFQAYSIYKMTYANESEITEMLDMVYQKNDILIKYPRFWFDPDFNNPLQPVVGVSWIEANAYCKWLSYCSGEKIRLPTEWEWEIVARGNSYNAYPYGNDFMKNICNVDESGYYKSSTPVGIFPEGKTDMTNCYDISGNVFEWADSLFIETNGKRNRATDLILKDDIYETVSCRGGAWQHNKHRATGYYRGRGNIFTRNNDLGFRLAIYKK